MNLRFNLEGEEWYVDLPEWEGSKADLLMVAGADILLSLMAGSRTTITLKVNTEPFKDAYILRRVSEETSLDREGFYQIIDGPVNEELLRQSSIIWLCPVLVFVFGYYPEYLYFRPVN